MAHPTSIELSLYCAWEFTVVLPGSFERNRKECQGKRYPIIGPLPRSTGNTPTIENTSAKRPYLYVIYGADGQIRYVGKCVAKNLTTVLGRWSRPGKETGRHYWAHGTNEQEPTVNYIAKDLEAGLKPITLYFSNHATLFPLIAKRAKTLGQDLRPLHQLTPEQFIIDLEEFMIYTLRPTWNEAIKRPTGPIARCGDYWNSVVASQ